MNKKQFTVGLLSVFLALFLIGCSSLTSGKTSSSELTLWYEASTAKLFQDDDGKAAKTAKDKQTLKINMARNESEGVQMLMYAKKDIDSYNVTVSDLKSEAGTIPAKSVDIYQIKYQTVEGNHSPGNPDFLSGEIPDPLLPIETAVEYGENSVKAGKNQAIYLDVTTDASTPAGLYKAVVTLETEKDTYKMPMEVTVYDVTLPDTAKLKTAFSYFDRDSFTTAELDGSDKQTTAYFETLLDYNMSSFLPYEGVGGADAYVELIRKYYDYPGFNSYRLFYQIASTPYGEHNATYNAALLKEYIKAIVEASIEDGVNYLDKAYAYFYTVADEPRIPEHFETAKKALIIYKEMLSDADAELKAMYAGTKDYAYYKENISETVLSIPNVLPGWFDMEQVAEYEIGDYTFVPLITELGTEADRHYYTNGREDMELWAYTCTQPVYPYPSGHTDDYSVGFRLTSWMCFDYDLDGYLYWGSVNYLTTEGGEVIWDPWVSMDTGFGRPGEARFFYPGEKYGLDYPCPSLRVMAYRDGVDDYSLLQAVEDIYNQYGANADVALQDIFNQVYTGVIPTTDSYVFESAREQVFLLLDELKSDVGVIYVESDVNFDQATLTLRPVEEDATVEVKGKKVAANEEGNYVFDFDLTKETTFTFKVVCGKEKKEYTHALIAGKLGIANGFEEENKVELLVFSSTPGYEVAMNENADFVKDGEKSLHITLNQDKEDTLPYFAILKESDLIGGNWKGIKSFKFHAYNAGVEEAAMDVTYYTSGESLVTNVTLAPGEWTLVEIPMPQDIDDVEAISEFDFNFTQGSGVDIYLDNFATIVEEE